MKTKTSKNTRTVSKRVRRRVFQFPETGASSETDINTLIDNMLASARRLAGPPTTIELAILRGLDELLERPHIRQMPSLEGLPVSRLDVRTAFAEPGQPPVAEARQPWSWPVAPERVSAWLKSYFARIERRLEDADPDAIEEIAFAIGAFTRRGECNTKFVVTSVQNYEGYPQGY